MQIILKGLPKISLNKFYAGLHWTKRKQIKDAYNLIIKSQCKYVFPKDKVYKVEYQFNFKTRPLDASNACGGMVKLIEDILFEDDKWDIVTQITVSSKKNTTEFVKILIT